MKKLIIGILVLCMAVSSLNINAYAADPEYVAQIGDTKYESIQAAVDAAQDGDTVTLLRDIDLGTDTLTMSGVGKKTIDFNNFTITSDCSGTQMLYVTGGSELTLLDSSDNKSGGLYATKNNGSLSNLIRVETDGKLIIESGNYHQVASNNGSGMIDSRGDEIVTINGGNFYLGNKGSASNGSPWLLNTSGKNTQNIIVNGGTYNDNINHQYWAHEANVARDKALSSNEKTGAEERWTVVDAVAYTAERDSNYLRYVGYASLEEAIAAASNEFGMVTLLKNCTVSDKITIATKDISIYCDAEVEGVTVSRSDTCDTIFDFENGKKLVIDPTKYVHCPGDASATPETIERATPAKLTFAQDVNGWCVDGYVAIENEDSFFDVVPGFEVSYYLVDKAVEPNAKTLVKTERVTDGGNAKGYTRVVEGNTDQAIFGWYTDVECENEYSFKNTVSEDISLYGKLMPAVIVDFEDNEADRQVIEANPENNEGYEDDEGVKVKKPDDPTKSGYGFAGWWYTEDGTEKEFAFDENCSRAHAVTFLYRWFVQ